MNRRPCLNSDPSNNNNPCEVDRPPIADYPRYSSQTTPFSDLLNFDIKIPGEHTLEGEEFDAEIQMLHTHLDPSSRMSSLGIPIRATQDGYNAEFQGILDQFQMVFDSDMEECRVNSRKKRNLRRNAHTDHQQFQYANETSTPDEVAMATLENTLQYYNISSSFHRQKERHLQSLTGGGRFDPYSESFMRDINFYRYDGSITEPPCLSITWWVMIEPMYISFEQLRQMKVLLFTHVDGNCRETSVHNNDQRVTRPIFGLGEDREIQRCEAGDFESDVEKGKMNNGNRCP
jgi:carbonic anhydrase